MEEGPSQLILQKKKEKTQIIREFYVKFHANNLDNLEEIYKFLERHKRPN